MTDWPPREEEEAAADDLHAAPPPPTEKAPEPQPLWQSPPRDAEPEPEPEQEPESEPDPDTPTVTTEPTDWFEPPPIEPVTEPAPPDYLHPPSLGSLGAGAAYADPQRAMDEVAFPLAGLGDDVRSRLLSRLAAANVACRLDELTLYARIDDAGLIETYIADLSGDEDIEEVIEEADEDEDEIVFDLGSLSTEERRHLGMRLTGAGISHIWEVGTDLVVSVQDAPVIESYIDEVRNPEGFGDDEIASFEEESDIDDEVIYGAMSNLYVAADKLMQRPADEPTAGEFYMAADDVDGLPAPFGFDPRVWSQVLSLTTAIVDALDAEADPDGIGATARTLREILVNYV